MRVINKLDRVGGSTAVVFRFIAVIPSMRGIDIILGFGIVKLESTVRYLVIEYCPDFGISRNVWWTLNRLGEAGRNDWGWALPDRCKVNIRKEWVSLDIAGERPGSGLQLLDRQTISEIRRGRTSMLSIKLFAFSSIPSGYSNSLFKIFWKVR
jgi:hypothetical protein